MGNWTLLRWRFVRTGHIERSQRLALRLGVALAIRNHFTLAFGNYFDRLLEKKILTRGLLRRLHGLWIPIIIHRHWLRFLNRYRRRDAGVLNGLAGGRIELGYRQNHR